MFYYWLYKKRQLAYILQSWLSQWQHYRDFVGYYTALVDSSGEILNFWLHIQNLCEHLIQMIYHHDWWRSNFLRNMAKTQIWWYEMPWMEFWVSDFRFRISVKIWSRWYIDHHDWWRSNFLRNMAKTQIWPHEIPWVEFGVSDFRFGISVRFRSRWYIDHHDWWRSNFLGNMAKTQMWSYGMPWVEFWVSDFRFRISVKFWSR